MAQQRNKQTPQSFDETVKYHPSFPETWQVSANVGEIVLQTERPALNLQRAPPIDSLGRSTNQKSQDQEHKFLAGQVFAGSAVSAFWIQTKKGYLPRATTTTDGTTNQVVVIAKPFWPPYRVVAKTNRESNGVAPYVYSSSQTQDDPQLPKFQDYDPLSPHRVETLSKRVGYVFQDGEIPITGLDTRKSDWWTNDERTWWPKRIPRTEFYGVCIPQKICGMATPKKKVMEPTVSMHKKYIKVAFQGRGYLLIAIILTEYLLIVGGALAGIKVGWSLGLQLVYFCCLLVLALFEVFFIAALVPNGPTWLKINSCKCAVAVATSALWRWDLYGDVGFSILAYQQRARYSVPLWIGSTVCSAFVICGRLIYSFYYIQLLMKRGGVDEKSLAKVSVPSFMNVFRDLCRTIDSDEGIEARRLSVTTELWFEILRLLCEDLPEIG